MKKQMQPGDMFNKFQKKKTIKLNPPSKGHAPKGAHGRAAVKALGRTKTTGNFKKIEAAKGKGAAIAAYQNALAAHKGKKKSKHMKKKGNPNSPENYGKAMSSAYASKYGQVPMSNSAPLKTSGKLPSPRLGGSSGTYPMSSMSNSTSMRLKKSMKKHKKMEKCKKHKSMKCKVCGK